MGTLIMTN